jgi:hypothetical protein
VRVPQIMKPDHRGRTVPQCLAAAGERGPERAAEPLRVQAPAFEVTERQRAIADERQGEWATVTLARPQQRHRAASMSTTRGLPVLVGPSLI